MQRNYRQITPTHTTRPYKMGNQKNPPLFLAFMLAVVSVLTLAAVIKPVSLPALATCVAEHGLDACAKAVREVQS